MTTEQQEKFLKAADAPNEIQVVVGKDTVTALKIGFSFMTDQPLYEAQMPVVERKPRKPKNEIPPGPVTMRAKK